MQKRQYDRLLNENGDLEKRIDALKKDVQSRIEENIGLKKELEQKRAAENVEEQASSGHDSRVDP